jgi:predicted porin
MTRPLALATAAAALALTAGAHAQSTAQIYGLMDMSIGQFQTAGDAKVNRVESGNMSTSFIGFKDTEDLGGGLKARIAIEHFLRIDEGAAGRFNGDAFWARSAYVGLEGSFGGTFLGRNTTPLFVSTLIFNPLGDSFGFSPSIRHYFLGAILGDTGWNNSIAYNSPNWSGLSFNLLGNLSETSGPSKVGSNLSGNVLYFGGPLAATAAWQSVKNGVFPVPAGFSKQDAFQVGASYDLTVAKLFVQIGNVKTTATADTKTSLYQFGAKVPVGADNVLVSYGNAKATTLAVDTTRKTLSVAYNYNFSKRTDGYAVVMNDQATGLSSGTTIAVGLRTRF